MSADKAKGAGGKLAGLLVYLAIGLALFAVVAVWDFAGLRIWGK